MKTNKLMDEKFYTTINCEKFYTPTINCLNGKN